VTIWIDADNCPQKVKEIIVKASLRLKIRSCFVANRKIALPEFPYIKCIETDAARDSADAFILSRASSGDLAVTADILLASELVKKDIPVINPKGDLYTKETLGERLSMRNFLSEMRERGIETGKRGLKNKGAKKFSEIFDKMLTLLVRNK
jgi:uncharacterized protein YaiI (UPF0178 family)